VIASALLLRGSAEGVSFFRIFGYEAYPQHLLLVFKRVLDINFEEGIPI
jgi:hypothetical protein